MQVIIGFGITGAVLLFAFIDASRFLENWSDKFLYLLSCMLMKPIFLPVLLPGSCFISPLSNKEQHQNGFVTKNTLIKETNFILAV